MSTPLGYLDQIVPPGVSTITGTISNVNNEAKIALQNAYTKYEVIIDVFKNGQLYDTSIMPLNSLVPVTPADLLGKYGFRNCHQQNDRIDVAYSVNQTVVAGGHHYYRPVVCGDLLPLHLEPSKLQQERHGARWCPTRLTLMMGLLEIILKSKFPTG